jgi:hypothetical protein
MPGEVHLLERSCVHKLKPRVNRDEGKRDFYKAVSRPCTKSHWTGLLESNNGTFSKWIHRFGEYDIMPATENMLGLN